MFPLFASGGSVEPLLILVAALILDGLVGDPPVLWETIPHPVALIGKVIAFLESRLNRPQRSDLDRRARGVLMAALMVAGALGVGWLVVDIRESWSQGWIVELALTWMLVAQRSLYNHVRAVSLALDQEGLAGGRREVSKIVGRDPDSLDEFGVARAAIESCAENFADGVVAPVFWCALLGFPGLLAYKTINTLDSMIGHRNDRYLEFGMASARLDDLVNLIPARLSGFLIALAALFTPKGKPAQSLWVMLRDHGHHRSPNSGWPEAAMAGALDLSLAGPRRYPGYVAQENWIGSGRAQATPADIDRALFVMAVACLINGGLVVAAALTQF